PVPETYRPQNNNELTEDERMQVEADDQGIHILLFGLPTYVYAVVDSCQTENEM
ncbi:hypothetical protein Tco_0529877, partial [Tanacetum coccineum]